MTDQPEQRHTSPFDTIQQTTPDGQEYWSARDLAKLLGYAKWDKFQVAIERAQKACEQSGQAVSDHFLHLGKLIETGTGTRTQGTKASETGTAARAGNKRTRAVAIREIESKE